MVKLGTVIPYLKRPKTYLNHVTYPLISADISNFSLEIIKFCYIKKYMYRLHFNTKFLLLLTFIESLKIVLIKIVTILMMALPHPLPPSWIGLIKLQAWKLYLKKTPTQMFSCEDCEVFMNNFSIEHLWWLLQTTIRYPISLRNRHILRSAWR